MFAIIPQGSDFIYEADAEFFTSEQEAYDAAFDWSAELSGRPVNLCHVSSNGTVNIWAQIYA